MLISLHVICVVVLVDWFVIFLFFFFFFCCFVLCFFFVLFFFFQAEDGIRDLVRSRGLGDVYKRQALQNFGGAIPAAGILSLSVNTANFVKNAAAPSVTVDLLNGPSTVSAQVYPCLLYTSDAADERSSVDLGGRRIIKKKKPPPPTPPIASTQQKKS
mgnify:CR=1 FL=1